METRAQFGAVPRTVIVLATLALLTALAAGAIAIGASTTPKLPPPFGPAANGLIAFVSDGDVYVVQPDGSGLRQLTDGPEVEDIPTWSRDGTKLAYWTGPDVGPSDLVVVDADGGHAVTVAETTRPYATLEWSADGAEIMYDAIVPELIPDTCPELEDNDYACGARLFVAATDGSGSRQVGDTDLTARIAVLSPDGHTVAFAGGGDLGSDALYLMEWDGSDVRRLETGIPGGDETWPFSGQSWSPDGKRIATHDGNGRIWAVDIDDSGALASVERMVPGYFPIYAPVGGAIIEQYGKLYAEDEAGAAPTYPGVTDFKGSWSPDATQLVKTEGESLKVYDLDSGDITTIADVATTPGQAGTLLRDQSIPSWQRVAS